MIQRSKLKAGRQIARVRSALSGVVTLLRDAAWAIQDRFREDGAERLRGVFEVVKWPFERLFWAIERRLIWPLEKRVGAWDGTVRTAGVATLALLAAGAGVMGLVWASGSGGGKPAVTEVRQPAAAAMTVVEEAPRAQPSEAPVLHGATPDFSPKDSVGASRVVEQSPTDGGASSKANETPAPEETEAAATASSSSASPSEAAGATTKVVAVGPAATSVAHHFANAFVRFETGQVDTDVRTAFADTATPRLARSLLHRPPRLPANVKVPRAKVLNVVPGPRRGDAYTLSVSLLRVGITSELRIEMERNPRSGEWEVTDVLG